MHPRAESNRVEKRALIARERSSEGKKELVTTRPGLDFLDFHGLLDHHSELSSVVTNKTDKSERARMLSLSLSLLAREA